MTDPAWHRALVLLLLPLVGSAADAPRVTHHIDIENDRVPLHTVVPNYPKIARRDRIEGDVEVCFNVNAAGRPFRIAVRNSTHRVFEKPAMRAVRASSYQALPKGEKPSGIKSCRTFRFRLDPAN